MLLPFCSALKITVPFSDFPLSRRFSGLSIPWSILFLTRWVRGSTSFSIKLLSISVLPPWITRSTFLPSFEDKSRTTRGNRLNVIFTGSMRIDITDSWISRVLRCSSSIANCKRSPTCPSTSWPTLDSMDWVITNSPTKLTMASILLVSTRIDAASLAAALGLGFTGLTMGCFKEDGAASLIAGFTGKLSGS